MKENTNDDVMQQGPGSKDQEPNESIEVEGDEILTPADLSEQLNNSKKQYDELLDKYQRSLAEFDNFRKRTAKEKTSMYNDGIADTIEQLLPVIDNFERAIDASANQEDSLVKGIVMIYRQFEDVFHKIGVEPIVCVGEVFDPNLHYAVAHEENSEYDSNVIIEEMQKGYKFKERVIRPSMVKVAN